MATSYSHQCQILYTCHHNILVIFHFMIFLKTSSPWSIDVFRVNKIELQSILASVEIFDDNHRSMINKNENFPLFKPCDIEFF